MKSPFGNHSNNSAKKNQWVLKLVCKSVMMKYLVSKYLPSKYYYKEKRVPFSVQKLGRKLSELINITVTSNEQIKVIYHLTGCTEKNSHLCDVSAEIK